MGGGACRGDKEVGEVAVVAPLDGIEGLDGLGDGLGKGFPLGVGCVLGEKVEGGVPESLNFDGITFSRGAGGIVRIHPGEVGGAEDEGGGGIHVNTVFGSVDVALGDGDEDVE